MVQNSPNSIFILADSFGNELDRMSEKTLPYSPFINY